MIHCLDSLDHEVLVPYANLARTNETRNRDWFIAEGRFVVERLLANRHRHEVISVVLGDQVSAAFMQQVPREIPVFLLPRDLVSRLVGFPFHAGIIACGRRRIVADLGDLDAKPGGLLRTIVICPETVLPDNLGSIIRLCTAFGVDVLIVGPRSADPWSRRSIRVSMGNIFSLPVVQPPTPETLERMLHDLGNRYGFHLLAATASRQARPLPFPRPAERLGIVLGNEAHGIEDRLAKLCHEEVVIPMSGETDSLNVSSATAVLLYQFTRGGGTGNESYRRDL